MVDDFVESERKHFLRDLNTIRITEGNEYGFEFNMVCETDEQAKSILSKFPKSYKIRLSKLNYCLLNIQKPLLNVHISFVPDKTTGAVNEAGRIRAKKIKEKLKQILPYNRVTTRTMIPVPGYHGSFRQGEHFEGYI